MIRLTSVMNLPELEAKFLHEKEFNYNLTVASFRAYRIGLRQFSSCWQGLSIDSPEFDQAEKVRVALLLQSASGQFR
jgi:hypothetical protein